MLLSVTAVTMCAPNTFVWLATREQNGFVKLRDKGNHYESSVQVANWTPHSTHNCSTCDLFTQQSQGGWPRKEQKKQGQPGAASTHTYWRCINLLGVQSFRMTMARHPHASTPRLLRQLKISSVQSVSTSLIVQHCCVLIVWSPVWKTTLCNAHAVKGITTSHLTACKLHQMLS